MSDQPISPASKPSIPRLLCLLIWLPICAFFAFQVSEFGAGVDGIGYGHMAAPTYITAVVFHLIGAVIIGFAFLAYRGRIGYLIILFLGPLVAVLTFITAILALDWHYPRVCDTTDAPNACYYASVHLYSSCNQEFDQTCLDRLQRACAYGHRLACERLIENGHSTNAQICDSLAETCDQIRQCSPPGEPAHCNEDSVPFREAHTVSKVCELHTTRCTDKPTDP